MLWTVNESNETAWWKQVINNRMWWQYLLVFFGAVLMDITPLPLPPAFTVMVLLQIAYDLNIWLVIVIGVLGSVLGRYVLMRYIHKISDRIFKPAKKEDIEFLGNKMKQGWKSQLFILTYSLMPLPTTPLFIAAGIAKLKAVYIVPAFFVGKFMSDTIAVLMGKYAAENTTELLQGLVSFESFSGLVVGLLLIAALIFIDWKLLLVQRKFRLQFNIFK